MKTRCTLSLIGALFLFLMITPVIPADLIVPTSPEEIHEVARDVLRSDILSVMKDIELEKKNAATNLSLIQESLPYYPEYPRRITDSKNTTITVYHPLSRLVAFNYGSIIPLDYGDKVIGVANGAMNERIIYPDYAKKINIGGVGMGDPDFETILSLNPDAITAYTDLMSGPEFFEKRLPAGVPVIRFDFIKPDMMVIETKKMGYLMNRSARAAMYEQWFTKEMNEIDRRLATIPKKNRARVFVDIWSSKYDRGNERRTASGKEAYSFGRYCIDAGGVNIAENMSTSHRTVDTEWVAKQNPDIILGIVYAGGYEDTDQSLLSAQYDDLVSDPLLKDVSAVKNNRIYIVSFRFTNDLGYPAARAQIAKWFYPDLFRDIDPVAVHQGYVDTFINASFNVSSQGVFVYTR